MFHPNLSNHPKPKTRASTPARMAPKSNTVSLRDRIRERAHQLYESRGRENGKAEQDWLTAEQEILNEHR